MVPLGPTCKFPRLPFPSRGEREADYVGPPPLQTGLTDIPLTAHGESIVRQLGTRIVGKGKILDPAHIQHVFVSPRQRAQKTYDLLFQDVDKKPSCSVEQDVREWEYGVCEGALSFFLLGYMGPSPLSRNQRRESTD